MKRFVLLLALAACGLGPEDSPPPSPPLHPLAYVSQGLAGHDDIFILSADASSDVNLTANPQYDSWPSWNPTGTAIAFESNRDDPAHTEVYIIQVSDGFLTRLTDDTGWADAQPAWSPLNNRIAFVSNRDSGQGFDIYLMNTDGQNVTRLTTSTDSSNSAQPSWSPDGALLAFATDRGSASGVGEIYVMDSTGGNVTNLTNNPANDLAPAWSPDGAKIAFMSDRNPAGFAIYVMNANGTNPVRVSPADQQCGVPSWTPNSLRLAFECDANIWVANADGVNLRQITHTGNRQRSEVMPRWKPVP